LHKQYTIDPKSTIEERLARFAGAHHCVTCGNGTDALHQVLLALGIGPGWFSG
jgi:UDP-2-acetamido-2-deoxy-ribo-hexuluronate aminotransferase